MPVILGTGYEEMVRAKFGVKKSELPDEEIAQPLMVDLAEAMVIQRVPDYDQVSGIDQLFLQNAALSYLCYLLCPGMARRLNVKVTTIDIRWEKERVDWEQMAQDFLAEFEQALSQITSVAVVGADSELVGIIVGTRRTEEGV